MPDSEENQGRKENRRFRFPKSLRLLRSEEFRAVFRSPTPALSTRREAVAIRAKVTKKTGKVRVGVTVGKHNVPRAVDRILAKRIMRESIRTSLPYLGEECLQRGIGLDVSLRICESVRCGENGQSLKTQKIRIERSMQLCVSSLIRKIQFI